MSQTALKNSTAASVSRLGLKPLEETLPLMRNLVSECAHENIPNTLLLAEHPSVYTLGRGIQLSLREKVPDSARETLESYQKRLPHPVVVVERGGGITFHDPGQLMGYPIVKLNTEQGFGVTDYLRRLELFLITSLKEIFPNEVFETSSEATGIWLNGKKVVSMGVAVRRWVTFHGFAINLETNLKAFEIIRPCGLDSQKIGNLPLTGPRQNLVDCLSRNFYEFF